MELYINDKVNNKNKHVAEKTGRIMWIVAVILQVNIHVFISQHNLR